MAITGRSRSVLKSGGYFLLIPKRHAVGLKVTLVSVAIAFSALVCIARGVARARTVRGAQPAGAMAKPRNAAYRGLARKRRLTDRMNSAKMSRIILF